MHTLFISLANMPPLYEMMAPITAAHHKITLPIVNKSSSQGTTQSPPPTLLIQLKLLCDLFQQRKLHATYQLDEWKGDIAAQKAYQSPILALFAKIWSHRIGDPEIL